MLPNEVPDSLIIQNGLIRTVWTLIASGNGFDQRVIDRDNGFDQKAINEGVGKMRDLILQNKGHVSLVNLYCIHISYRDCGEAVRTHGTVECHKVPEFWIQQALVISSKQVHHSVHCKSSEGFHEVLDE